MIFSPFPHQQLGIDHLINHDEAGLFAGMGLGKTATVLAALDHLISQGDCKGALIIAPLRVSLFTWLEEVAQWENFHWLRIVSLRTPEGLAAWDRGDACIYTINYEALFIPKYKVIGGKRTQVSDTGMLTRLIKGKRASHLPVDTIIWDEISKAKSHKSKRIKEFAKYRDKFKRHWGLTGTPAPGGYQDLFAQINLLDGGKRFGEYITHFLERYFEPVNAFVPAVQRKWQVREGCAGLIEEKIRDMVLTLRSEDYLDIPPTEFIDVGVALPAKAMTTYKKLEKELIVMLKDAKVKAINQAVLVGKLQQVTGGACYGHDLSTIIATDDNKIVTEIHDAKIKALRKLWESEGKQPMIVGTKFRHERERILAAIPEAVEFHSSKLDDWNAGKIPLLVAHPASMSHGLNMQHGGSRVVWFTPTYSPEEYDQMNARVARTGQTQITKVFHLVVPGTIDDAVLSAIQAKSKVQSVLLKTLRNLQILAGIR
jgi:SNF2 family DNA or RNA helicase